MRFSAKNVDWRPRNYEQYQSISVTNNCHSLTTALGISKIFFSSPSKGKFNFNDSTVFNFGKISVKLYSPTFEAGDEVAKTSKALNNLPDAVIISKEWGWENSNIPGKPTILKSNSCFTPGLIFLNSNTCQLYSCLS